MNEDLLEALFDIAGKYDANVTNNEPRMQDGEYLYHVGEFIADVKIAFMKAGWIPPNA